MNRGAWTWKEIYILNKSPKYLCRVFKTPHHSYARKFKVQHRSRINDLLTVYANAAVCHRKAVSLSRRYIGILSDKMRIALCPTTKRMRYYITYVTHSVWPHNSNVYYVYAQMTFLIRRIASDFVTAFNIFLFLTTSYIHLSVYKAVYYVTDKKFNWFGCKVTFKSR